MKTLIHLEQLERSLPNKILMTDIDGIIKFMPFSSNWKLNGNNEGALKYIGTNDNFDFPIYTNNIESGVYTKEGNYGLGINAASIDAKFYIKGTTTFTKVVNITDSVNNNLLTIGTNGDYTVGYTGNSSTTKFNIGNNKFFNINANALSKFSMSILDVNYFTIIPTALNEPVLSSTGVISIYANNGGSVYSRYNESAGGIGINIQVPSARFHISGATATSTVSAFKVENIATTNLLDIRNNGYTILNGLTLGKGISQIATNVCFGIDVLLNNTTGVNNISIGSESQKAGTIASNNTSIGHNTLRLNIIGIDNVAIGSQALETNLGSQNTAVGAYSLLDNTIGVQNTAIGNQSMLSNNIGSLNTAVGWYTLRSNQSGQRNVAIGWNALEKVTNSFNVGVGYRAGANIDTGEYNTAVGNDTMSTVTSGSFNTFIGRDTGRNIDTGSRNTIIGASVTGLSGSLSDTIILATGGGVIRYYSNSSNFTGIGGTLTPVATLHIDGQIAQAITKTSSSNLTVNESMGSILCNNGVTSIIVALPTPVGFIGKMIHIGRDIASTAIVTISTPSGQIEELIGTLNTTTTLSALGSLGAKVTFVSDGTNWLRKING